MNSKGRCVFISMLFAITMFLFMVIEELLETWLAKLFITLIGLLGVSPPSPSPSVLSTVIY